MTNTAVLRGVTAAAIATGVAVAVAVVVAAGTLRVGGSSPQCRMCHGLAGINAQYVPREDCIGEAPLHPCTPGRIDVGSTVPVRRRVLSGIGHKYHREARRICLAWYWTFEGCSGVKRSCARPRSSEASSSVSLNYKKTTVKTTVIQ